MIPESRYERVKLWARRHEDAIMVVSVSAVLVGLAVISVKADMTYRERLTTELNDAVDQLNALYHSKELV